MRQKRLYALFEKRDGRWERVSKSALIKEVAIRVFQDALLAHVLEGAPERSLRPVKE
jgi:hypothetical protein